MKIYRAKVYVEGGICGGFLFATSMREIKRLAAEAHKNVPDEQPPKIDSLEISCGRFGLLRALRLWAKHPDNG
jgi:hypothetical protein